MEAIFWCEFPEKIDWKQAKKLIKFNTEIYVAVKTKKEYQIWEKKIKSKNIKIGAWPRLTEEEGYWFSGFIEKEAIDQLKEFNGLKIKVDIEPPFPGKINGLGLIRFILAHTLRKGENNKYLVETIRNHKGNIIISGFPLPGWLSKRYGDITVLQDNMEKSFISYTTMFPILVPRIYIKLFARRMLKKYRKKAIFAIGCTGKGALGNEKTYTRIEEFRKDLEMMKNIGAKKIVVYNLEGIMEKADREEWLKEIEKITYDQSS
jgi:hypothetical protein